MDRLTTISATIILVVFMVCLTYNGYDKRQAIVEMVERGATPLEARVAVSTDLMDSDYLGLATVKGAR